MSRPTASRRPRVEYPVPTPTSRTRPGRIASVTIRLHSGRKMTAFTTSYLGASQSKNRRVRAWPCTSGIAPARRAMGFPLSLARREWPAREEHQSTRGGHTESSCRRPSRPRLIQIAVVIHARPRIWILDHGERGEIDAGSCCDLHDGDLDEIALGDPRRVRGRLLQADRQAVPPPAHAGEHVYTTCIYVALLKGYALDNDFLGVRRLALFSEELLEVVGPAGRLVRRRA